MLWALIKITNVHRVSCRATHPLVLDAEPAIGSHWPPVHTGLAIEVADLLGAAGMAQLADGLVLNLADTLTGNAKDLTHFL